jgi:hypothetical protein
MLFHFDVFPAGRKLVAVDCVVADRFYHIFFLWPPALRHRTHTPRRSNRAERMTNGKWRMVNGQW